MPKKRPHYFAVTRDQARGFLYVWIAAMIGVLFYLPMIPKLIPASTRLPFPMNTILWIAFLQYAILTAAFSAVGAWLTPKIGFQAHTADVTIRKRVFLKTLKTQMIYGVPTGFAGAVAARLIAPGFIAYLNRFTVPSRLFYGGLTEEVIMRWCIMTVFVWVLWRVIQRGTGIPEDRIVLSGVVLSQMLFAAGHFPALIKLGIGNPWWSVLTIFIVSLPWGWLFWKKGLEAAFIAHASFHAFTALFAAVKW
jgi:hypothetical protein